MIYKKNGKLLVKDGKLCSTCCIEPCEHCISTPNTLKLTLGNPVNCPCTIYPAGAFEGNVLNVANTYILPQSDSDACLYEKETAGSFGTIKEWDIYCAELQDEYDVTHIRCRVWLHNGFAHICIQGKYLDTYFIIGNEPIPYSEEADCGDCDPKTILETCGLTSTVTCVGKYMCSSITAHLQRP